MAEGVGSVHGYPLGDAAPTLGRKTKSALMLKPLQPDIPGVSLFYHLQLAVPRLKHHLAQGT